MILKQTTIASYLSVRSEVATLKQQLREAEAALAQQSLALTEAIAAGAKQQPGRFTVALVEREERGRVAWKEEFARACGAERVAALMEARPVEVRTEVQVRTVDGYEVKATAAPPAAGGERASA